VEPAVYVPVDARANLRRSLIVGGVLGLASVVILPFAGYPLMGVFVCLGIALGAVNNRMLQQSVLRYAASETMGKKQFRRGVMGRLGLITLVAIGFGVLIRPDGLGVFFGLAAFQILMLIGAAVPVFRSLRPTT
jgi:hypothetical protein